MIDQIGLNIPAYDIPLLTGATAAVGLTIISWRQLEQRRSGEGEEE